MSDSFFFLEVRNQSIRESEFVKSLEAFSSQYKQQVYVVDRPLSGRYSYDYPDAAIVLIPNHKICLLDFGEFEDSLAFNEFKSDLIEDLASLSDRYEYKEHLGRPRVWQKLLIDQYVSLKSAPAVQDFLEGLSLEDRNQKRVASLLISLLLGSICDIGSIGVLAPENYLDAVKRKIVLFDGDQSRFIYEPIPPKQKRIKIQGLAGTGKTELLLHKLRELYTKKTPDCPSSKIFFTCFNKILAKKMRERIPDFFNFMKVQEQIEWERRLWVASSWGSSGDKNSGLYSYVCDFYGIPFEPYRAVSSFDDACRHVVDALSCKTEREFCLDYILIDEAQDFGEHFFEMCEMVASQTVYVAGDVFQNIFDTSVEESTSENDYLLNRCYRTDHRTLMFAHALGMGLCEKPVIRWLQEPGWKNCGYDAEEISSEKISLSRQFIRQLSDDDFPEERENKGLYLKLSDRKEFVEQIISIIKNLKTQYPTIEPGDIAVAFPDSGSDRYSLCDELVRSIRKELSWNVVKGYETKGLKTDSVFISNRNNIKGLEFPFVICFCMGLLSEDILFRNALYMILTRSFISSYFILDKRNMGLISKYKDAYRGILSSGKMVVRIPEKEEIAEQRAKVEIAARGERKSLDELFGDVLSNHPELSKEEKQAVKNLYMAAAQNDGFSGEDPKNTIEEIVTFYLTSLKR